MLTRMDDLFVTTLREDPADAELTSHKLLVRAGYIRRAAPGVHTWLPLGLRTLRKIEQIIREEMDAIGGQEVLFSALQPAEPYQATGRWEDYGDNLFRLKDRRGGDYLLAPTHEEMFALIVKDMITSYKELPLTLYQIQTKFRDELRVRGGLLRGRDFLMKDAYSFDLTDEQLDASYADERLAYARIFDRLGLDYVIVSAMSGAMGGSKSEEFLLPSPVGEDTFVTSPGGYVANTEAVTTPAPEPVSIEGLPEPLKVHTPDAETIETMVDAMNEAAPRKDRPWQASDTLKNVVFTAVAPTGERELVVIGLPGDREVDTVRLEGSLAPFTVEKATDEELAEHPELVPGYIGPEVVGPNARKDEDDEYTVSYFVDPRVSKGSIWASGSNEHGYHTANLVAGRDFQVDGFIEAAEVRDGDPAPDGSGPMTVHRGIEIGHIFQLGKKYAEALGVTVLDKDGKQKTVTMGSYGIGVSRVLAAVAEVTSDEMGLAWPAAIAPYDVDVVVAGKGEALEDAALVLAEDLSSSGLAVLLDDRKRVSAGVKFADSELIGIPITVVVGRGLKDGVVEVRQRRTGERENVPVDDAYMYITRLNKELIAAGQRRADQETRV